MKNSQIKPNAGFTHLLQESSSDEVLRLTWAVIDGVASVEDRRRLGELVTSEYEARKEYVNAVRLDRDLADVLNSVPAPRFSSPRSHRTTRISPLTYPELPLPAGNLTATG